MPSIRKRVLDMCNVTKCVIGYKTKQTQIQRFLPKMFHSCTGVLRLTMEIIEDAPWLEGQNCIRVELNTPVSHDDIRGWYNFATWENSWVVPSEKRDTPIITTSHTDISLIKSVEGYIFTMWPDKGNMPFLNIEIKHTGNMAGPPNEDDNEGTFYYSHEKDKEICYFKPAESIDVSRERCTASFNWDYAHLENMPRKYHNLPMVCEMKCDRILGAYMVKFQREFEKDNKMQIIK